MDRRYRSMADNAPMTPEDRPATLGDLTTAIDSAEQRIVDRLTEVMRDMQTEILNGLQAFARGNFARFNSLESHQSDINIRLAAIEERVMYLETRRPPLKTEYFPPNPPPRHSRRFPGHAMLSLREILP